MAAATMMLETRARGRLCQISLRLDDLSRVEGIEQLDISLQSELRELRTTVALMTCQFDIGCQSPSPDLLQDYGAG